MLCKGSLCLIRGYYGPRSKKIGYDHLVGCVFAEKLTASARKRLIREGEEGAGVKQRRSQVKRRHEKGRRRENDGCNRFGGRLIPREKMGVCGTTSEARGCVRRRNLGPSEVRKLQQTDL